MASGSGKRMSLPIVIDDRVVNGATALGGLRHFTTDPKHGTEGTYITLCGRTIEAHGWVTFTDPHSVSGIVAAGGGWNSCRSCISQARKWRDNLGSAGEIQLPQEMLAAGSEVESSHLP